MFNKNYDQWKTTEPLATVIAHDWEGEPISYDWDLHYYETPEGLVLDDVKEIERYMGSVYGRLSTEEMYERRFS